MKKLLYLLPLFLVYACQENAGTRQAAPAAENAAVQNPLADLFEEKFVIKMHLFGMEGDAPEADYPYTGKPLSGDALAHLDERLNPGDGASLFACYHVENTDFYVLRSGRDLILGKWAQQAGKLEKVMDLASKRCGTEGCQQQDAWLTDLDDDRTFELVIRSRSTDPSGKVLAEDFTVLSQNADGHFTKSTEQLAGLAVMDRYVLH